MFLNYQEIKREIGTRFTVEHGNIAHREALEHICALATMIDIRTPSRDVIFQLLTEQERIRKDAERLKPLHLKDMEQLREIAAAVLEKHLKKI